MITIIACMARNRVIGKDNQIPWRFPADLKHFREQTINHTVVMGRKTYESVGPLISRNMIIMSTERSGVDEHGMLWTDEFDKVLKCSDLFVAGGEQIYHLFLPEADRMMLTYLHFDVEGDTYFPYFDPSDWEVTKAQRGNQHSYLELERN